METYIFGKAGAGKTTAARALINNFIAGVEADKQKVYTVTAEDFDPLVDLPFIFSNERPAAIVFDGLIVTGADLKRAALAVRIYALSVKFEVLAVYCIQGERETYISFHNDK